MQCIYPLWAIKGTQIVDFHNINELLYADDLVVIAETEEDLIKRLNEWKDFMENRGMRVNMNKTKVMISGERQKVTQKAVRWPCGVCGTGVGNNSIQCTSCKKWVHRKCGIKGSMYKVMKSFICRGCVNPVTGTGRTSVDVGGDANLELVDKFCYLGDMLSVEEMLMQLWRPEFELDGINSGSWFRCLPIKIYH